MPFDADLYHRHRTSREVGARLVAAEVTTSTMDDARAGAAAGGAPGTVYLAEAQTAGRGRLGRPWASAGSGLYATYHLIAPDAASVPLYPIAAALAVADAVRETAGLETELKWPNDVLIAGRKLAGILAEGVHGPRVDVFLGIGLNVRTGSYPPELAATATSIEDARGAGEAPPSREVLLAALSSALERHLAMLASAPAALVAAWRARLFTLGQPVRLTAVDGAVHEGLALDVGPHGELRVRLADGRIASFAAGEVTTAPALP